MLSDEALQAINREIEKYPAERRQAAVMATLAIAQREKGWLDRGLIDWVAGYLEIPAIRVMEVATFYSMYDLEPVGTHKINVCTNVSCLLCGSDQVVEHLESRLGIKLGETTGDGRFTLREVECLAACVGAPMMQVDEEYYEQLTPERIDEILNQLEQSDA